MQTALDNAANQLTNETKHTFYSYGPNDHNWDCPELNKPSSVDDYLNTNFSQALENADSNGDIYVSDIDIWILLDLADKYGYGDGGREAETFSSDDVFVGRTLSFEGTSLINEPNDVVKKVIKHNLGHCGVAHHNDANYTINSNNKVDDISPMAWAYIEVGEMTPQGCRLKSDSCNKGSGNFPSEFNHCASPKDQTIDCTEADGRACGCTGKCHHSYSYAQCTVKSIEATLTNRT